MNLFALINRGVDNCRAAEISRASERARKAWIDSLTSDEIRAWMNLDQKDRTVLFGLGMGLSAAALAAAYDAGTEDLPDVRVIRGALSAIEQAGNQGGTLTADTVQAVSSAAARAREVLPKCSLAAIAHAAELVGHAKAISEGKKQLRIPPAAYKFNPYAY